MGVIPRSHNGPLYNLYDETGEWTGALSDEDIDAPMLRALSILVVPRVRSPLITAAACTAPPLIERLSPDPLLCAYSAAHAIPITNLTAKGKYAEVIVRGERQVGAVRPKTRIDPPDWSKTGYKSIFEHQQGDG